MNRFSKIYKTISVLIVALPFVAFAQFSDAVCSSNGYTIETINGIFTDKVGARDNKVALQKYFPSTYNGEPLTIDFLLNKTHSALDITDTAIQKTFEGVNMWDPDFIAMLNDASTQVKTQKLLLVSHSQGNFYANNVYKVVTDSGDVSKKSIGVYGVASPASYVAGEGRHLTSSTDKVIAFLVENVLPGTIAPTNDTIDYKWSDDPMGHDFAKVYLEYRPQKIVDDIKWSLDKLSLDPIRSENTPCINPPKELSTLVKIVRPAVYATKTALVSGVVTATIEKNTVGGIAVGTYKATVATAVWSYNTTIAVAVWSYNTTTAVAKFIGNTTVAAASTIYNAVAGALSSDTAVAGSNSAAVILATQAQTKNSQVSSTVSPVNKSPTTVAPTTSVPRPGTKTQPITLTTAPAAASTGVPNPSLTPVSAPKLVFVGSFGVGFGGGGGAPPQVLGTTVVADEVQPEPDGGTGGGSGPHILLPSPALSAPQCAYSLATSTDGCLLATTTIHFDWTTVSGASHYTINKNGAYATTTEVGADIVAPDFSDYTFEVSAVDADGYASATSTKTVSVATIPIAINEIAWMGTVASTSAEWVEIKNNTAHTIDLSQWALASSDSKPFIVLTGTIAPREYRVLERWLDATVVDVTAGQVYGNGGNQWALGNSGEQLNLFYASTTLDQTPSGAWVAGENSTTTRKTMERYSSRESGVDASNWGTNLGYIKNGTDATGNAIAGTPGAQNSVSTLINKGQDITSDFTLTDAEERYVVTGTLNVSASSTLNIAPGVEIKFREEYWWHPAQIEVNGAFVVQGTGENPVEFSSFTGTPTGSVELRGTATSSIASAHFDTTYEGVNVYSGAAEITDSSFSNIKYEAVGAYSGAQVSLASSTITNILRGDAIGVYDGAAITIASTTIDGVPNGSGIVVYNGTLSIASSTIKNVDDSGIQASRATSTISNTVIENAGWSGIDIYKGKATITDTTVSDVDGWAGISVDAPVEPVVISGGEVFGNESFGVSMGEGEAILFDVSVHDNGTDDTDNIVVW